MKSSANAKRKSTSPRKKKTTRTKSALETRAAALTDIPNVGPATAADLRRLGIAAPRDLAGRDPIALYHELQRLTGMRHDPCVADVFIAAVRWVERGDGRPWWAHTARRKRLLASRATAASTVR
jgi:hypothetical protein